MSDACCTGKGISYPRVLWIALVARGHVPVEVVAAAWSGSRRSPPCGRLGDSANYALSLGAIALGGAWISRVALLKGAAMSVYGVAVLTYAAWRAWLGVPPEPITMSIVGMLALLVNLGIAVLLYRFRNGDANMHSVWLCTRNDIIANVAVLVAAAGVFGTGTVWPDVAVAAILAVLGLSSDASCCGGRVPVSAPRQR
jgi:Co/Zn/Cd efflux system component